MTAIGDTHAILHDLLRAKCVFQLRTIEAVIRGRAIVAGTQSAETNEDLAQSEGCQNGPSGHRPKGVS